jgi:hypothetical protein
MTDRHFGARSVAVVAASVAVISMTTSAVRAEPWPSAVQARYKLKFQGIDVGRLEFNSETSATGYKIWGNSNLSVLLGAFKVKTSANVSGAVGSGEAAGAGPAPGAGPMPLPKTYAFDWQGGSKKGNVKLGFENGAAKQIAVDPPPSPSPETVPLTDKHKVNVVDPVSAIMALTRNDGKPCEKRAAVFDGKHRFDIVFSHKKQVPIKDSKSGGLTEMGTVCRVTYQPIAGHKAKAETASFATNREMEVVLRRVPGGQMMVPHAVYIPTGWGTASIVLDRIDVTHASGKVALTAKE